MGEEKLAQGVRRDYLKWLQIFIEFCAKYRHPFRDRESLQPFLQKLASKRQSTERQEETVASVRLYYEIVESSVANTEAAPEAANCQWDAVLKKLKEEIRLRQYSPKTLQTYRSWIAQFQSFVKSKKPGEIGSEDARGFLTYLAVERRVAASTQNQALNALLFLNRHILKTDYDLGDSVKRAKKTKYIPVVLSRHEIDSVLGYMKGPWALAVGFSAVFG